MTQPSNRHEAERYLAKVVQQRRRNMLRLAALGIAGAGSALVAAILFVSWLVMRKSP